MICGHGSRAAPGLRGDGVLVACAFPRIMDWLHVLNISGDFFGVYDFAFVDT